MRLDTSMSQRMTTAQVLAPRMIQSMEILQLPIMALQERIQQELQENPVLELNEEPSEEQEADEEEAEATTEADDPTQELVIDDQSNNELDFDRLEALSRDWEDHFNEEHRPSRNSLDEEGDKKHDAMQNMASRPQSLQDYLNDQLSFLDTTPEQDKVLRHLIAHIDENGYLTASLEDVAQSYEGAVTAAQVE